MHRMRYRSAYALPACSAASRSALAQQGAPYAAPPEGPLERIRRSPSARLLSRPPDPARSSPDSEANRSAVGSATRAPGFGDLVTIGHQKRKYLSSRD